MFTKRLHNLGLNKTDSILPTACEPPGRVPLQPTATLGYVGGISAVCRAATMSRLGHGRAGIEIRARIQTGIYGGRRWA